MDSIFDVAIIGGGINGCGCAADAALRGLSVVLLEKNDLASKTSSSSTKLIHGGLRYLEHYEFGLVRKALKEREVLFKVAPHIVYAQAFILPYLQNMRPAWLLRLGLWVYDWLSLGNQLPRSRSINRKHSPELFKPLTPSITKGFLYYDGATDDARLTLLNALQAKQHGASIRPQSEVLAVQLENEVWNLTIKSPENTLYTLKAKSLINAAGPWVNEVAALTPLKNPKKITLVKGSHIVVPKLFDGHQAYLLQSNDQRIVFAIPYQDNTLIGTTDVHYTGDSDKVSISPEETDYLISLTNQYFNQNLTSKNVLFSWSGLRPLLTAEEEQNLSTISRDYSYLITKYPAPMITVYGGKITTYRFLAAEIIDRLKNFFTDLPNSKTQITPLPGAQYQSMEFNEYKISAQKRYSWLPPKLLERYLKTYGTLMEHFLSRCSSIKDMGTSFGSNLYQAEVDYLIEEEWALTTQDILLRRTKLGYLLDFVHEKELSEYLSKICPPTKQ